MFAIDGDMHQIRIRFVEGVLAGMPANDLHRYVTRSGKRQERKAG